MDYQPPAITNVTPVGQPLIGLAPVDPNNPGGGTIGSP